MGTSFGEDQNGFGDEQNSFAPGKAGSVDQTGGPEIQMADQNMGLAEGWARVSKEGACSLGENGRLSRWEPLFGPSELRLVPSITSLT